MQTLNLTDPTSVREIFEQISRMLPFRIADLTILNGILPESPNQLAIVDNVGVFMYRASVGAWVTVENTELEAELVSVQQTLTSLAVYVNQQFTTLNELINSVEVTADQISGLGNFVRDTTLAGLSLSNAQPVVAGVTLLDAVGRLQRQITDAVATLGNEINAREAAISAEAQEREAAILTEAQERELADLEHTTAENPHTQYLKKADLPVATDAEMQDGVEDAPRRMSPRQIKLLATEVASVVVEEVTASKQILPDVHYVVVASGVTLSLPATVASGSQFTCMDASGAGFLVNWGAHTVKFGTPDSPMRVPARAGFSVVYSGSTFA